MHFSYRCILQANNVVHSIRYEIGAGNICQLRLRMGQERKKNLDNAQLEEESHQSQRLHACNKTILCVVRLHFKFQYISCME